MTEQEMFIEALMSQFMEPEFQFPDIGRRVAELSIQNNDMTWRIWQAARATPADQDALNAQRYRWLQRQRSSIWKELADLPWHIADQRIDTAIAADAAKGN